MRRINKGVPFDDFVKYLDKHKPSKWEELNGELRYNMRLHILLYEQDCLCGYSEIPLDAENTSSHIDHFVKCDYDHSKIFDWDNLVVSAMDEDYGGKYKDNTYKIKQNEYAQIFNPTKDDMGQYIEYLRDGRIAPRDGIQDAINDKILKTIEVFNLNCRSLKNRRKQLLIELDSCSGLPKEELKHTFEKNGFISLINWFIGTL
ncbi:MAG: TIGR02646 family protein [Alphaproteobacteria bacterium]|nr:TIGR02646 family protein [Alphaproteobacteria bacterium]MBQ6872287.1 TIGR02646 family protein [Bacteroidales bacterium]